MVQTEAMALNVVSLLNWFRLILNQVRLTTVVAGVGILIGSLGFGWGWHALLQLTAQPNLTACSDQVLVQEKQTMVAEVSGAVTSPGVYVVSEQARLSELIQLAGGFSASASGRFIGRDLNLASRVTDGQKVYVPFEDEMEIKEQTAESSQLEITGVSINSASVQELQTLPGIGSKRAEDIVANRPYSSLTELTEMGVLTSSVFEQIETQLSL